jgi:hypothetical protein
MLSRSLNRKPLSDGIVKVSSFIGNIFPCGERKKEDQELKEKSVV